VRQLQLLFYSTNFNQQNNIFHLLVGAGNGNHQGPIAGNILQQQQPQALQQQHGLIGEATTILVYILNLYYIIFYV